MSSKNQRKPKTPDYQKQFIVRDIVNDNWFARVYGHTFYDKRFRSLKPMSRIIYIAMVLQCVESENRIKYSFPYSKYKTLCSKSTFIKCKRELIENGFIRETFSYKTKKIKFALCDDWKQDVIPKREPEFKDDMTIPKK